jgi:hypothetical protein
MVQTIWSGQRLELWMTQNGKCALCVSGGLNPRKSGGGKRWRDLVMQSGVHFWWRILAVDFGAGNANSKGPVEGPFLLA